MKTARHSAIQRCVCVCVWWSDSGPVGTKALLAGFFFHRRPPGPPQNQFGQRAQTHTHTHICTLIHHLTYYLLTHSLAVFLTYTVFHFPLSLAFFMFSSSALSLFFSLVAEGWVWGYSWGRYFPFGISQHLCIMRLRLDLHTMVVLGRAGPCGGHMAPITPEQVTWQQQSPLCQMHRRQCHNNYYKKGIKKKDLALEKILVLFYNKISKTH